MEHNSIFFVLTSLIACVYALTILAGIYHAIVSKKHRYRPEEDEVRKIIPTCSWLTEEEIGLAILSERKMGSSANIDERTLVKHLEKLRDTKYIISRRRNGRRNGEGDVRPRSTGRTYEYRRLSDEERRLLLKPRAVVVDLHRSSRTSRHRVP